MAEGFSVFRPPLVDRYEVRRCTVGSLQYCGLLYNRVRRFTVLAYFL
jgi:hypothetical protein